MLTVVQLKGSQMSQPGPSSPLERWANPSWDERSPQVEGQSTELEERTLQQVQQSFIHSMTLDINEGKK